MRNIRVCPIRVGVVSIILFLYRKNEKKQIYGAIRKHLGEILPELPKWTGVTIEEGRLMPDHINMCISIPPKYAVSNVVDYLKGKSAISIVRKFQGRQKNFTGEQLL